MCSQFQVKLPLHIVEASFSHTRFPLRFPMGRLNIEPRDEVTIGDSAAVVVGGEDGPEMANLPFAWKAPNGRPVFNFRSEGRRFDSSRRCLIPASGFFEFTEAQPGQKRKTRWLFTLRDEPWFWMAGIVRDGAFALLTTAPGDDIAPYHDRQVVVLPPTAGPDWLDLSRPEGELLRPLEADALAVERVFPPLEPTLL
ncbi:SOS response-associated peptidase family protein [Roseibacterium beibuensis]|uniref:SOS response-associated peptidase family protein n=1 Tax=[Roseibacterium] beibuensis TaxID=1193142 RepID=UPI00217E91E8|nr:SOS response-associated peptidase family protein [Roseibacterium beibuensis]MCS6624979.1 SOS response-associated peptidase family protein [Roseibacterium beibuensis]